MTASTEGRKEQLEAWHREVAGVLAKARKKDVSEMPADAWRTLETTTLDDIVIEPLYTRDDELTELGVPGEFPFVRGGKDATARAGWLVAPRVSKDTTSAEVKDALDNGVTALWVAADADVDGVLGQAGPAPVLLCRVGKDVAAKALSSDAKVATFGATPLTDAIDGHESMTMDDAVEVAKTAGSTRTFAVDGLAFHELGASDTQELGWALAAGIGYVKAMTEAGMSVTDALGQISFRLAATDDQFATIAKLRAARLAWARVAEALGAPEAGSAPQHAVTSRAMLSQRDPYVNMLRNTIAAFGAGVGGADVVTVLDFDEQIPGGWPGLHAGFAERMSRNVSLILLEESHLGHVVDPAGGSWYVESLTEQMAAKAWEIFQGVEAEGGFAKAAEGSIKDAAKALADKRYAAIAKRKQPVTGVSEFPNLGEAPLPAEARGETKVVRYGAQFEQMRDRSDAHLESTGTRPTVLLAPLGTVAEHNVRTTFTSNLLASGGIDSRNPGQLKPGEGDFEAKVTEGGEKIAVLCSTDKIYTEQGAAAVEALRKAGVETVYLAGAEASFEGVEGAGRPDGFLNMRINAVEALQTLLEQLGVK